MANVSAQDFILGIDLGSNSIGWAMVRREKGAPSELVRAGVRVFEAGMEGDLESGQEESRNLKRREARLHRRQLWRRGRRLTKIFNLLQRFGLLPPVAPPFRAAERQEGNAGLKPDAASAMSSSPKEDGGHRPPLETPEERQDFLNKVDKTILASPWFADKKAARVVPEPEQVLPYLLRAAALDEPLEPYFLGRALYHLAQRRGFLSNRKQTRTAKKDDDEGVVKKGISELRGKMVEAKARTLGDYFARLASSEERIRGRWTSRSMYEDEFHKIWDAQANHHPALLTEERRKLLFRAIFFQRPLKFPRDLVGYCQLEPERHRAPMHLLSSQRFRLLQRVNDLRILPPGETEREPTPADRGKLIEALELQGDLAFPQIRKLLGLPRGYQFNLEAGGEQKLPGNRTASQFYAVFGQRWLEMAPEERDRLVGYVHAFQKPDKLTQAAKKKWGLDDDAAERLAEISLEGDYMNLSRQAMEKLLPLLEQNVQYATARRQLYPASFKAAEPAECLPRVDDFSEIRNPAVMRSLTELRRVVNAVVRQWGKPAEVRIELARDLKKSKKQRQGIAEKNRANEKARKAAAQRILEETGISNPSPDDIRKVLLAEECRWVCPYTGRQISMRALVGPESQFQIEHILPFKRSLDNSFFNLTLCYVEENKVKADRTPHEAYAADAERYQRIQERVARFNGDRGTVAEKLRRFKMTPEEVEEHLHRFTSRQLTDTAYASRLAAEYVGLLYGGVVDPEGHRRVQATSGQVTAYLRNLWLLNAILKDGPTTEGGTVPKSRDDHRHHAVDAIVTALTDAGTVKQLSDAAQRAPLERRRRFASLQAPWPNFVDSVREEIDRLVVSHRVERKVSGALHEETIYSRPFVAPGFSPAQVGEPSGLPRERGALRERTRNKRPCAPLGAPAGARSAPLPAICRPPDFIGTSSGRRYRRAPRPQAPRFAHQERNRRHRR